MHNSFSEKIFLLAEDDKDDRELFHEALSGINTNIILYCTENGSEAVDKLVNLHKKPHLIFLDINMPVMNGWQCLKQIKDDPNYRQIPVIVYSTSSHQKERDFAMDLGAIHFFSKPDDFQQWKEILERIVNNLEGGLYDTAPAVGKT